MGEKVPTNSLQDKSLYWVGLHFIYSYSTLVQISNDGPVMYIKLIWAKGLTFDLMTNLLLVSMRTL